MNLIILAAGQGKRLYPLTKDQPKSLIQLGDGTTLLDRQLKNAITSALISKVYVVTGYLQHQIEGKIAEYLQQIPIVSLYNPFYDVSNNLLSLWCAYPVLLEDDFLVSNGDNIYKAHVYDDVLKSCKDTIQLTIDYKDHYDEDDMKVRLNSGMLVEVSKKIQPNMADAESVGLVAVRGESARKLFHNKLLELVKDVQHRNSFWLELFNALVDDGAKITTKTIDVHDWGEVDFHPDIEAMKKAVFNQLF